MVIALLALLVLPAIASAAVAPRGTATYGTTTGTSLTINKPTGVTTGDVMIVTISKLNNRTNSPTATGWTLISGANLGGNTQRYGAVLYRVATASDVSVTSYTFALGTGTSDAVGGIVAFSGVDSSAPFDVTPGAIQVNGSSTTVTATGVTTAGANAAVVMLGMASSTAPTWSGWTTTSPGALSELLDRQSARNSVGAAWAIRATFGTTTGNGRATLSGAQRNGGLLLALKPALIPLTVSAAGVDKTYDGTTAATVTLSSGDVQAGDTVTYDYTSAAFESAGAGTKTVNVSGISIGGSSAAKYTLQNTTAATTADITPADLIVTAGDQRKTYGDDFDLGDTAFTTSGLVTGDSVDTVTLDSAGAVSTASVTVLPYAITASAATGTGLDNYDISYADGELTVDPKNLTIVGAVAQNRAYDGDTAATVDYSGAALEGAVVPDDVDFDATAATASFDNKDAGTRLVTVAGVLLSGGSAGNYALTQPVLSADITPAELTVADGSAANKRYDGTTDADVDFTAATLEGVVTGEDVTLDATAAAGAFVSAGAGDGIDVTVSGLALGGTADLGNYALTQPVLSADITPAELTVVATGHDKVYDGKTDAAVTLESGDIIGSDVVTIHHTSAAFADQNVGTGIAIAVDGITIGGADAGNYDLQDPTADASASITPAALTVAATGQDKVYDGATAASVALHSGDVVAGDVVTAQYTGAVFADKNVGTGIAIAVDGISISGADIGNYALQNTTAAAAANITAKALTITAADQAKQYGQVFAFTGGEFTVSGLVSGDTVDSVTLASAGADAAAVAGIYPIVAGNAVGAGLGNYAVTYTDGAMTVSGGAVVTPTYKFSAFARPLRAKDKKKFHVGAKVLVKFTITDDTGAKVTTLKPQVKVTAKGLKFAPKTAKYNVKKKAYTYTLKIGKSWKLRGYKLTTTLAGSTAKATVKFRVVK